MVRFSVITARSNPNLLYVERLKRQSSPFSGILAKGIKVMSSLFLLKQMVLCECKIRDQGSVGGFFWTLLNPLILFVTLYFIFGRWFSDQVPHYGWYLIIGLIHWNFFSVSTSSAMTMLEKKRGMIKDIPFPRALIPLTTVLSVTISYALELTLLFVLVLFFLPITFSDILLFWLVPVGLVIFSAITSLALATAYVFVRDTAYVWQILLRIGFFVTPVFYPLALIPEEKRFWLFLNPLTPLFEISRFGLGMPFESSLWLPGMAFICGLFLITIWVWQKMNPRFAEYL